MGMAAHDNLETGCGRAQIEFVKVMQNVNVDRIDLSDFSVRNAVSPIVAVVIAANRNHRCDRTQLFEHVERTDVTGMQNEINTRERRYYFRTYETMSVGNYT